MRNADVRIENRSVSFIEKVFVNPRGTNIEIPSSAIDYLQNFRHNYVRPVEQYL